MEKLAYFWSGNFPSNKTENMKSLKTLLFAAAAFTIQSVTAQTADEVVNNYVNAMGGKEKLASLNSVKMTGSINAQGMDIPITMTRVQQKGMRLDMEIMGSANYQMMNETEGWVFMPVMGMTEPKKMEDEQFKSGVSQMDIQGSLFNYKDKGNTVELAGADKVDGKDAIKLTVTSKAGKVTTYWLDAKTYFLIKTSSKAEMQGQEMDMETTFADYKQNADGFWFPYSMTTMNGTITYEKIETNVKVDESIFKN